jgi:hypothetical protein
MTENDKINKYQNGKIYSIRSHNFDKYYIGSTCIRLSQRLYTHEKARKDFIRTGNKRHLTSCNIVLEKDNYYIELLENFPCNTKDELHKREGELIRLHKKDLVNVVIAGRKMKDWYVDNREEQIVKKREKWHSGEGAKANELRRNTKVLCECCEMEIRKDSMKDHLNSKRHINNSPKEENNKITL